MVTGIVAGRDDHDRYLGMLRPQVQEPGQALHARHGQIEQDEIGFAGGGKPVGQLVERAGLDDLRIGKGGPQRLAQRAPEQGMIVDDDEAVVRHARHSLDF